jgi:hypothetical protein
MSAPRGRGCEVPFILAFPPAPFLVAGPAGLLIRLIHQAVGPGCAKTIRPLGQVLDHENRKTPISRPAANDQSPNVQAEITRTRLRRSRSCGISLDRSVIAARPLRWPLAHYERIGNPLSPRYSPPHRCPKEGKITTPNERTHASEEVGKPHRCPPTSRSVWWKRPCGSSSRCGKCKALAPRQRSVQSDAAIDMKASRIMTAP